MIVHGMVNMNSQGCIRIMIVSPPERLLLPVALLGLFAAALWQASLLLQPVARIEALWLGKDDTYYYLLIAQNAARTGIASFDGLHRSSGVQLLWHELLTLIARVVSDRSDFLRAVLALCTFLDVAVGLLLLRIGSRWLPPAAGSLAAILWAMMMAEGGPTFEGMEYPLHILVILATLDTAGRLLRDPAPAPAGLWAAAGVLLALNFWARLDSAVFSAVLWGLLVLRLHAARPPAAQRLAALAALSLPPALGAALYVATSLDMAGTLLPLSGTVKAWYGSMFFAGIDPLPAAIARLGMWLKIMALTAAGPLPPSLLPIGPGETLHPLSEPAHLAFALLPALLLALAGLGARTGTPDLRGPFRLAFVLLAAGGIHAGIMVLVLADFAHVTGHYYGWMTVVWLLLLGTLGARLAASRPGAGVLATLCLALGSLHAAGIWNRHEAVETAADNHAAARLRLAAWMNANLPPGAVIGAWNAGLLGYVSERPVVNLDGLANDTAFLDVLKGGTPIEAYLRQEGIAYLVDHNRPDLTWKLADHRAPPDPARFYRRTIPWAEVEILRTEGAIYLLHLRTPGAPRP